MHLRKIELKNVKTLEGFTWDLGTATNLAGWHVVLGDNGSGKSTFLKSCAVALLGPKNALGLRLTWADWIRQGEAEARINLTVTQDSKLDQWSGKGNTTTGDLRLGVKISGSTIDGQDSRPSPERHVWGGAGWFSASFGPYRRFSGGNQEFEKLFYSMPKLASHLSIFGEDVALSETLTWLRNLHYEQLDAEKRDGVTATPRFLGKLKYFINQDGLLPNGSQLHEIGPKGVLFIDPTGTPIEIVSLSDGFRSILSLALELIRQFAVTFGEDRVFSADGARIELPGIVLIDEIDVHLHPKWQRSIGPWLTQHFPNVQFIVTTHSPLVCQGAINGSITMLPDPATGERGGRVTSPVLHRLLYGDILEALGSGAFGDGIGRSDAGYQLLAELAALNVKGRKVPLSSEEQSRREELQVIFGGESALGTET